MTQPPPHTLLETAIRRFDDEALPTLERYVSIPCLSPAFDADWATTGAIADAAELLATWCRSELPHADVEVVELEGRTPVLFIEVAPSPGSTSTQTTLIYGHLDKQPPLGAWREGLEAFRPVISGDRLYGRGAADDGYSTFVACCALRALSDCGGTHGRVVVLIEASEESGSPDLEPYLDLLADRIGNPAIVVCLDSGCATYDRLWVTTSLRGVIVATLRVDVLDHSVHSGEAGGIVPSSFRLIRELLSRIEDETTGEILLTSTQTTVPDDRRAEMVEAAELVGTDVAGHFPAVAGLELAGANAAARLERSTWGAALAVTGAAGLPALADAGNVVRPYTALRLALRLPPNADAAAVAAELRQRLTSDPPEGARVTLELDGAADGWVAPRTADWLASATDLASNAFFGAAPRSIGLGGSIPFLASLARRYPTTQFLATGVLGPESNAHGPNESLHLPTARALTATLAQLFTQVP